jgi:large subunit ribosomal protein L1
VSRHGRRYAEQRAKVDREREYAPAEAVALVRSLARSAFDESVEVHIRTGLNVRHADEQLRGTIALPNGLGKDVRIAVFAQGDKAREAEEAGADFVGGEDLAKQVESGFDDFDVAIATPDMMGVVGPLGKVLGPRGLMPSPRAGTVTQDVATAVREYKAGKVEFRSKDKGGGVHCVVGKLSFSESQLIENIEAMLKYIHMIKPPSSKGIYMKSISLSATMMPGINIVA